MVVLAIEHIVSTPGICGGKPHITGTRMRVQDVAIYHRAGMGVGEMVEQFDLTPGQVHAALSYYHDHREEIETLIQKEVESAERYLAEDKATLSSDLKAQIETRRRIEK